MEEYGRHFTVKGTYRDGTIEVNPGLITNKVMQLIPEGYMENYRKSSSARANATKADAAAHLVDSARNSIAKGKEPSPNSPEWAKKVYRYVQAGDAMARVYGDNKFSRAGISEFNERNRKYGTAEGKKYFREEEKKLRKKLKGLGF